MIGAAARWAAFPLVFGGAFAAMCVALEAGANVFVAVSCTNLIGAALIIAFEQAIPHQRRWNRSHDDVVPDAIHLIVTAFVIESLPILVAGALTGVAASLADSAGGALWPSSWPLAAQLALAIVVAELGSYWLHRGFHGIAALWRVHAVHHAAPRLYWLNATRLHPLEALASLLVAVPLLILLGAGSDVVAAFGVVAVVHRMLQHANIDYRLGVLGWIFSVGDAHRWHHSERIDEANTNFGSILLVWDIAFGTRYLPRDRSPELVGIDRELPAAYLGQLAAPFRAAVWRDDSA